MENQNTPHKTPSKFLENLPKDIREAVNKKNQMQLSPFCVLPTHTTPPSRFIKIRNPFEAAINEQLHKHIFSPSVFAEVKKPQNSEKFKWTIDDVSALRPANIDVSTVAQFEQLNPEEEATVQAKIEQYFSETHIVPSPWNQETNQIPLITESVQIKKSEEIKEMCNVWTQTVLSLPPKLPEAVEKALLPYFTFTEDQRRQTVDLNSSLCRRLFNFESGVESVENSVSSIHSEISVIESPIMSQTDADKRKRTYDSSPELISKIIPPELSPIDNSTPKKLSDCQISPIAVNMEHVQTRSEHSVVQDDGSLSPIGLQLSTGRFGSRASRSFAVADFSGHMSVDTSFNLVPENELIGGNSTNLSESPVRSNEFMESSCNWDLEYNSISINNRSIRRSLFESKRNSAEKMDISNVTTPKSKNINSQPKNLSDSFKFNESLSDEEIVNIEEEIHQLKHHKINSSKLKEENFVFSQNTQDTGYSTSAETSQKLSQTKDEEDIVMSDFSNNPHDEGEKENWNFFASTPSKRYFANLKK